MVGTCQGPGLTIKAEERFPVCKIYIKVSCFGKVWGRKLSVRERSKALFDWNFRRILGFLIRYSNIRPNRRIGVRIMG